MQQSSSPFKVIRIYDPAIDTTTAEAAKAWADYIQDRDVSGLRLLSEPAPIIFTCKRLTPAQQRIVGALTAPSDQYEKAFSFGVVEVANLPGPNGPQIWIPKSAERGLPMEDDDLDRFGFTDRQEIGYVIRAQSFLALGARLRLPPLAISLDALTTALFRSAGLSTD